MNKLTDKVNEAIDLDRQIAKAQDRLKELKAELVKAAESDLMDKTATDGGGWSVEFPAADGSIARVTQPGPKLKATLDGESAPWLKIKAIIGSPGTFFETVVKYTPVEKFRELIAGRLSHAEARKVMKLMTVNSAPTVSFETKEVV